MIYYKRKRLNNKTRKGTYIYIKETGKAGRYYKYSKKKSKESYLNQYNRPSRTRQPDTYIRKIKSRGTVDSTIRKGVTSIYLNDIHAVTPQFVHEQTKKLIAPLVLDPELLDIMAQEENLRKFNHRFEHRIIILTDDNDECANIVKIKMTPLEAKTYLTNNLSKGEYINSQWIQRMKNAGYWVNEAKQGKYVFRVDDMIIFRRG